MKAHYDTFLQWKCHFDWIARSWQNRARNGRFYKLCLISQKLSDNFSSYYTKWRPIMTPFFGENAILIESPEVGQIGQNWAKNGWFYKLCLISQKLSDNFSSNRTKWKPILTPFFSENAILIELPEIGRFGQNWVKNGRFYKLPNFSKTVW